jgi:hypothetical protein
MALLSGGLGQRARRVHVKEILECLRLVKLKTSFKSIAFGLKNFEIPF